MESKKRKERVPADTIMAPSFLAAEHPNGFFFVTEGGGMSHVIPNGALVLIDPDVPPENGCIAAVELADGEPYLRRWYRGHDTLLLAADGYELREDMVFRGREAESVTYLGRAVWFQSDGEVE